MTKIYIIYEIRPINKELIYSYVGSTENFIKRKSNHKRTCINSNLNVYKYIRENGGWINFEMVPLEEYECDTKIQARIREQFYINQIENKLNMIKAFSTIEENKNKQTEQKYIYRFENKNKINTINKIYREENKEKIAIHKKKII
jgi:hypothetical protein